MQICMKGKQEQLFLVINEESFLRCHLAPKLIFLQYENYETYSVLENDAGFSSVFLVTNMNLRNDLSLKTIHHPRKTLLFLTEKFEL
jgi:hypothetical protein